MTDNNAAKLAEALENCASEPVHTPGTIQSHGHLIAFTADLSVVTAVSDEIDSLFDISADELFNNDPAKILPAALFEGLNDGRQKLSKGAPNWSFDLNLPETPHKDFFCTSYAVGSLLVLEIEPVVARPPDDYIAELTYQLDLVRDSANAQENLEQLTKSVIALSGYERVLVYQFDSDWNGKVVAEKRKSDDIHSYLGHSFPASDIPSQVRALYKKNALRDIVDATVSGKPISLNPDQQPESELDLTAGVLRGVSPIHLKYLSNMGVKRALSVAIFEDNKLWGLLSCHGLNQHQVHPYQRHAIKALVAVANERMLLQHKYAAERFYEATEKSRTALLNPEKEIMAPEELLETEGEYWLKLFDVSTIGMVLGRKSIIVGDDCDKSVMVEAAKWLAESHSSTGLFSTNELDATELDSIFADTDFCGLLAVALPYDRTNTGWLLFLRQEVKDVRNWAGHPEKTEIEHYKGKDVLSPRDSFASWQETIRGKSLNWKGEEKQAARLLAEDLAIGSSAYHIDQLNNKLQKANKRLKQLAHTDALTQLANRYHMEKNIEEQIAVAKRYNRDLGAIMLDIDDFKDVNDTYGHDIGDKVLQNLARALEEEIRDADGFARWGGEEFLILAIEQDLEATSELAERLRKKLSKVEFEKVGHITASFGVAEIREGDTHGTLVKRADEALYKAKNSGKNKVVRGDE